ncbi:MAG TPA: sulfatase [Nocardioidaceae bacterium]|nr:sulfatase [Nocardioidaceae bacterium]
MHKRRLGVLTALCVVAGLTLGLAPADPPAQAVGTPAASIQSGALAPVAADAGSRPNIVLFSADDMRADDLEFMPRTRQLLGRAGTTFTDAISNYPLCCPARAVLLTGQYSHNNGVQGNKWPAGGHRKFYETGAELETLPVWLKRAGYNTGLVGKYLNNYGATNSEQASTGPRYVPPGWDEWHASVGGVLKYYCVTLNHNGRLRRHPGEYQTDLYTSLSTDFIREYAGKEKPFFLWASHFAPHVGVSPRANDICGKAAGLPVPAAERHKQMFDGLPLPEAPSINEEDMSDKGTYMNGRAKQDLGRMGASHRSRIESLQALDESVADTVAALKAKGVLDDTLFVFTSDNGWLLGEHRAHKKTLPYEEALKVPLMMRGPGLPTNEQRHQPVSLVDIPATVLELAGATATKPQDGVSLMGHLGDPGRLARRIMPIEAGPEPDIQKRHNLIMPLWLYRGVRSSQYSYIAWQIMGSEEEEFYDLDEDPFQLDSRHEATSQALITARAYYEKLRDCAGPTCVDELPAAVQDGNLVPRRAGDTTAPQVRTVSAPKGWIRTTRPTVRYTATDATDPDRSLSHWCSHQAIGCDGEATLKLGGEGRHHWTILVTDRAGNVGSRYGKVGVDLHRPRVTFQGPRNKVVNGTSARLPWQVSDSGSGVASVDTRRRVAPLSGPFGTWRRPAALQGKRLPAQSAALPAGSGTVCLETRARDVAGRVMKWTGRVCRSRAVDAATLASGPRWRTVKHDSWYAGTGTVASVRGAALTVPSTGGVSVVRLVARTGPGMGRLRIDVGGGRFTRINLDSPRKGLQEFVLRTPGRSGAVKATVVSAGKPVWVDSIGVVKRPAG